MSFCDESEYDFPLPQPVKHMPSVHKSKARGNDEFVQLNDASAGAKRAARKAFEESTNAYDAATKYLSYMNRILTHNVKQKSEHDVKIALDGIDGIDSNGDAALQRAKTIMKIAIDHWMHEEVFDSKELYVVYNPSRVKQILL